MKNDHFKYDIFISYKHEETDKKVAQYLQRALEQYKIPKEIQKKTGKTKISRVFRDEEELAVASDLSEEIEEQLRQTEFLLVVCSKKTKESIWVQREIKTFLKYRSRRYVLPVLVNGEPEESFPQIILDGGEPLAADVRGSSQKEILANAKKELPRIIAPVLKCSYDELRQRHKAYQMKRIAWISVVIAAIALLFGAYSVKQNLEIKENYTKKQENQSRYLAQTSEELLKAGDREAAMLVALAALPESEADDSRPLVAEARMALEASLYLYQDSMDSYLLPYKKASHPGELRGELACYNGENPLVMTRDNDGFLYIWDAENLNSVNIWNENTWRQAVFNRQGMVIADSGEIYSKAETDRLVCRNPETGDIIWEKQPYTSELLGYQWTYNEETDQVVLLQYNYNRDYTNPGNDRTYITLTFIEGASGEERVVTLERQGSMTPKELHMSQDGSHLAVIYTESLLSAEDAKNEICIYQCQDGRKAFSSRVDGWLSAEFGWIDNDTFAGGFSKEYSMGFTGSETAWKVTAWSVSGQNAKWTYEDVSLNLNDRMLIETYDVKSSDDVQENIVSILCNNVHVVLNKETGNVYNRMEDHNVIQNVILMPGRSSFLYFMQTGDVCLSGVYETYTFNPVWDYNYEMDVSTVTGVYNMDDIYYVIEGANLHTYKAESEIEGAVIQETGGVLSAGFSPQNTYYYCCNGSYQVILGETDSGEVIDTFTYSYSNQSVCFVDDTTLAYISTEKCLNIYDISTGTEKVISLGTGYSYQVQSYGTDKLAVWGGNEYYLFHGLSGELLGSWSRDELESMLDDDDTKFFYADSMLLTENERYLIFLGSNEGTIYIWDLEEEKKVELPDCADVLLADYNSWNAFYKGIDRKCMRDDQIILYGKDKKIRILDISQGEIIYELETDGIGDQQVVFTPDGEHLVYLNRTNQLRVLNWKTGEFTVAGLERLNQYGTAYFTFAEDGSELFVRSVENMSTPVMYFYERTGPGVYEKQTEISYCYATNGDKVIVKEAGATYLSEKYSLDELIAFARERLGGRELTAEEKNEYLVEN